MNKISTAKYNVVNFLPKNLLLQFTKLANLYFLILSVLQCITVIGGGIPTLLMPLSFVVSLSMIKDGYEDYVRNKSDNEENNRKTEVIYPRTQAQPNQAEDKLSTETSANRNVSAADMDGTPVRHKDFEKQKWCDLKVGTIVKVYEDEYFPCDIIILKTSLPKGLCYVETKNLDGETNLKHKQADKKILAMSKSKEEIVTNFDNVSIECEAANASIYTFQGVMRVETAG